MRVSVNCVRYGGAFRSARSTQRESIRSGVFFRITSANVANLPSIYGFGLAYAMHAVVWIVAHSIWPYAQGFCRLRPPASEAIHCSRNTFKSVSAPVGEV